MARRRLLDVPGHEPRPARSRASAARRRPTATSRDARARAAAPTWSRCRSPRRPPSAARCRRPPTCRRSSSCRPREPDMEKFTTHTGVGVPLRRSNVDTDQIIPAVYLKRVTRDRLRGRAVLRLAQRPDVRAEQRGVRRGLGARRRSRLRHRLVARARGVGAAELRLPGRHLAALRRHLPRQLRQGRTARRAGRREGRAATLGPPRGRAGRDDHRRPRVAHRRAGDGPERSRTPSTSTTTRGGVCSKDSTTSASRSSHDDDIATYESKRPSWKPATL